MAQTTRTFRIFVSSTFSDLKVLPPQLSTQFERSLTFIIPRLGRRRRFLYPTKRGAIGDFYPRARAASVN